MKVIVRIAGGLGNQLFCYAAARRLALVTGAELVIDEVSGFEKDAYGRSYALGDFAINGRLSLPKERFLPFSKIRRCLIKKINEFIDYPKRTYIREQSLDFDRRFLDVRPVQDVYVEGYWQSEKYFIDIEDVVRTELSVKTPMNAQNANMANFMDNQNSVAIHVRFFDDPSHGGNNNIEKEYYSRAIFEIENRISAPHYFIFSDKIVSAVEMLQIPKRRFTAVDLNSANKQAYADLWLMKRCRGFIIANSTFSWWGAWLCDHRNKVVVAPSKVINGTLMKWGFNGLLPEEWLKL